MPPPQAGDPFQVEEGPEVLEVEEMEWGASRSSDFPARPEYYVVRTREGDRYVLLPLEQPILDVRWRGVPLRRS